MNAEDENEKDSVSPPSLPSSSPLFPKAAKGKAGLVVRMPYPNDEFRYGDGEDDVITHKGKEVTQQEADDILKKAQASNVALVLVSLKSEDES